MTQTQSYGYDLNSYYAFIYHLSVREFLFAYFIASQVRILWRLAVRLFLMHQLQTQSLFFAAVVDSVCLWCDARHTNTMIMYELFYVYECVRVCRSSSFTSSHHINITDFCCLSTSCLFQYQKSELKAIAIIALTSLIASHSSTS